MSIPALFVLKDGKVVDQALGYKPKEALVELVSNTSKIKKLPFGSFFIFFYSLSVTIKERMLGVWA